MREARTENRSSIVNVTYYRIIEPSTFSRIIEINKLRSREEVDLLPPSAQKLETAAGKVV